MVIPTGSFVLVIERKFTFLQVLTQYLNQEPALQLMAIRLKLTLAPTMALMADNQADLVRISFFLLFKQKQLS